MKKLRSSTKILIGFVSVSVLAVVGFNRITAAMIMGQKFAPIAPGRVNIVGINPGAGYRVIVANEIAQLVETQGDFNGDSGGDTGSNEGAIKRRIPIKELLGTLRGEGKALGQFVMWMNNLQESEKWPTRRVFWQAADIQKALDGDSKMTEKLESALNVRLDGTPLNKLDVNALEDGIVIVTPVTLDVNIDGKKTPVTGDVMEPYKPHLITETEAQYADKPRVDNSMRLGYYRQIAQQVIDNPKTKENVRKTLENAISKSTAEGRLEAPRRILSSANVIINESFINDARYNSYTTSTGKPMHDLTIDLNDEGRRRLWQFSANRVGNQLLLVADGVAIAAARIQHPLAQGEVTITQMQNEGLVKDAVQSIKDSRKAGATTK